MSTTVRGRTALVTGAGSGIGAAIAQALAREGAHVVAADIDASAAEDIAARIRAAGGSALAHRADVTATADVDALCQAAESAFGSLDILVNNAGILSPEVALADATDADWDRIVRVNTTSQFLCARAAARIMARHGYGRIVTISSRAALGSPGLAAYAASKAAVVGLTRSLALELGPRGITVNSVAPGAVETPLFSRQPPHEQARVRAAAARYPVPRLAQPAEIAHAVVFFAADESAYITGQVLYVCGGRSVGFSQAP